MTHSRIHNNSSRHRTHFGAGQWEFLRAGAVDQPKGDPGNTLSRVEIGARFARLVRFANAAEDDAIAGMIDTAWHLRELERIPYIRTSRPGQLQEVS